jgi:hypothetical protein
VCVRVCVLCVCVCVCVFVRERERARERESTHIHTHTHTHTHTGEQGNTSDGGGASRGPETTAGARPPATQSAGQLNPRQGAYREHIL